MGAEKLLSPAMPNFDDVAVLMLDVATLPAAADVMAASASSALAAGSAREAIKARASSRAMLRLCALPPAAAATAAPAAAAPAPAPALGDAAADNLPGVNTMEFQWEETFGDGWDKRWTHGPATVDEKGKPIREGLIKVEIAKHPITDPKTTKSCMQLISGAANAPCTGIWTTLGPPLCKPTEIEFEFAVNGKVDHPNACVIMSELPYDGALPECKIGVQFLVRGGMHLAGGSGNLLRISNDGKMDKDRWNKVLLKLDWDEKIIVGQVDTRGKGYAPAVQTVPFRDTTCRGLGYIYIYNTDQQGICQFTSLRIKQESSSSMGDITGLEARAELAERLKQKEYDRAVAADMEAGMKMGAISCTKAHGMNLAQEQAANFASAAGAAMGR